MNKSLVAQWLERVDYDLSAARSMLKSKHLLYVAFLCQQAVEKVLKAMWCARCDDSPPYTHNLGVLVESLKLSLSDEQLDFLELLNRFYIVGRYPTFKQKLASSLQEKNTTDLLKQTEEFILWCRQSIPM
ncbi:MAG: hypothetical protein A2W61_05845 [Deltaproteobacteria bacterium RIFCSPLOWO2_01_44_7]|nr:MAG: hypothetical protein A2712_04230 [Deltaproteobacteria bacterium RIFCSPHIGHO2_01_FULL_43_49]OGQ16392.1 MAG: hypothetical protein A3D22_02200 [Deltaproteobacteria bacterium RIFCSPHIGHO2_02_FULL_44_53]OGQ27782.1 MAG: hypothetical protein A3D98_08790 [Deltaproteobacteria bacterium RIFCSPHIGHO2_12_FULL_44_21]OGQ32910.1 MAG: hypothetical protein A2979_10130 [Deltaproteobacteria bacterium RIFCSPLOWO2_01_FULL_45_74]OGQ41649.1 MAG: hypothetical protein A2W61_05845 [Deltaproteobacteria bacterium 